MNKYDHHKLTYIETKNVLKQSKKHISTKQKNKDKCDWLETNYSEYN